MALDAQITKKLNDFTLEANLLKGSERLGILGASGDGKSMTLKCIAGIEKPDKGRIVLNNRVLFDAEKRINLPPQKRKVGYLFQNYALFPNMTVEENIAVALAGTKEQKREQVSIQMKKFHLEGLEKNYPAAISGGQQQRVALARIMAYNPELIMLDEPFSALDSFLKDLLQEQLLESLENFQGDMIMVSHSRDEIYRFCEKLVVFVRGKAILAGETKDVFKNPQKTEVARLTGCKNITHVRRVDEHTIYCPAWDVTLTTKECVSGRISAVGIRAHALLPASKMEKTNTIQIEQISKADMPFEIHYKVKNRLHRGGEEQTEIWWYVSQRTQEEKRKKELPACLYFPPEALMLLE